MFDFFWNYFRPVYLPRPGKICRECGREYRHVDEARICEDWDKVLGTNRERQ